MHLRTTVAAWQQPITVGNGQKARLAPGNTEGCSNVKVEIIQGKPLPNFKDDNIEAKNVIKNEAKQALTGSEMQGEVR